MFDPRSLDTNQKLNDMVDDTKLSEHSYDRAISHAYEELRSLRTCLRWMCVDHSTWWGTCVSWFVFVLLVLIVPAFSHFTLDCPTCDAEHNRPFDSVVQLSLSSVATLSFLCLCNFVRQYGLRRSLFLDKLVGESDSVRHHYATQLNRSLKILSIFVLPCFALECVYKIWWYASGATQIFISESTVLSDVIACTFELMSWLYRILVFFLMCVLFRLVCHLQILRLEDFATGLEVNSDVKSVLMCHLSIRKHLRIISHRYRRFILGSLALITMSLFTSLVVSTRPDAEMGPFRTGELVLCSMTLLAGLMIILRSSTKITHKAQAITHLSAKWHVCVAIENFDVSSANPGDSDEEGDVDTTSVDQAYAYSTMSFQKREALVKYFQNNKAGITLYGFMLDRTWLRLVFGIELSLLLWLLKKIIII